MSTENEVKPEAASRSSRPIGSADGDAGAKALIRCLPTKELQDAYRLAKADESDKGQHAQWLISRELIRRASPPNDEVSDGADRKEKS